MHTNASIGPGYTGAVDPHELVALETQWGPLPLHTLRMEVDNPFLTHENQQLTRPPRRAEICYISSA